MIFEEIYKQKLKDEDLFWRYIDLHKPIDLAINKELHFTRLDQFNDPFEGIQYKLIVDRYLAKDMKITNPSIPPDTVKMLEERAKAGLENYEVESNVMRKSQFVNCWIKSPRESNAMWNIYSNKDSIALKGIGKEIIEYFKNVINLQPYLYPEYNFICGSVEYIKLNPIDLFEKPRILPKYSAFKKDVSYDYEKEYRFLIVTPKGEIEENPTGIKLGISENFYKNIEIICHPEMDDWKFKNLESVCSKYGLPNPKKSEIELIK